MQRNAKTSVMWSGIQQVSVAGIQFIITIILARILSPSDYGLIAMLTIFFAFSQAFVDSGLSGALIQKKEVTDSDYNAVFVFCIFVSLLLYLILFFSAPLIAHLFHNELLVSITRVYMLDLVINAICMVPFARLQRELKFDVIARITTSSSFISGCVAIWMAYSGYAYWSLVVQLLLSSSINALCYWISVKWKPGLKFSYDSLKSMMSFGIPVMLTSVINSIYNNIYSLVIGGKYSAAELGLYNRANSFASFIPANFSGFSLRALFPVLSRFQNSLVEFKERILTTLHFSLFFVAPLNLFILFFSDDIIRVVFTEKWLPMSLFLRVLSVSNLFYIVTNLHYNALKSLGKTKELLKSELTKRVMGLLVISVTVWFGIKAMVFGLLGFSFVEFFIGSYFLKINSTITIANQFRACIRPLLFSIVSGGVAFVVSLFLESSLARCILCGVFYVIVYVSLSIIWKEQALHFIKTYFVKNNDERK